MSGTYNPTLRNQRLTLVLNALNAGGAGGAMRLLDSGSNILSTLPLAFPAGTISGVILTFSGLPLLDPAASASGVAVSATLEDSTGTIVESGLTVGNSSAFDVILSPGATIVAGQTIAISQATITGN